jgi:hypothetical protein
MNITVFQVTPKIFVPHSGQSNVFFSKLQSKTSCLKMVGNRRSRPVNEVIKVNEYAEEKGDLPVRPTLYAPRRFPYAVIPR